MGHSCKPLPHPRPRSKLPTSRGASGAGAQTATIQHVDTSSRHTNSCLSTAGTKHVQQMPSNRYVQHRQREEPCQGGECPAHKVSPAVLSYYGTCYILGRLSSVLQKSTQGPQISIKDACLFRDPLVLTRVGVMLPPKDSPPPLPQVHSLAWLKFHSGQNWPSYVHFLCLARYRGLHVVRFSLPPFTKQALCFTGIPQSWGHSHQSIVKDMCLVSRKAVLPRTISGPIWSTLLLCRTWYIFVLPFTELFPLFCC